MSRDDFQQAWQAESSRTRVKVDASLLQREVQRNQQNFRAIVLRRDVIEVAVGLILLPIWIYMGVSRSLPWTWYLTVPVLLWIIGYLLVDRARHPQAPTDPGEPLLSCVKNSLQQVEHQTWLLRNVFWWYLLPPTISVLAFFTQVAWQDAVSGWDAVKLAAPMYAFLVLLYSFLDYINQRAVCTQLFPRRQELLSLLSSLDEEQVPEPANASCAVEGIDGLGLLTRWLAVSAVCLVLVVVMAFTVGSRGSGNTEFDEPARGQGPAGESLAKLVTDLRKEKQLVSLAARVMADGQLHAEAAQGQRKVGSGVSVELDDRWHLGGITKSITATMIGRLIERGEVEWSDTVGDVFADQPVDDAWKPITLRQLVTDSAAQQALLSREAIYSHPQLGAEASAARREEVLKRIARPPENPERLHSAHSNFNFALASAMVEKLTGENWRDLVQREVFEPLQLEHAGFGPPKSDDQTLQQPRGHRAAGGWKTAVTDTRDNTAIMAPSGMTHMTLADLTTYAEEHRQGEAGAGTLLSAETYRQLHTPFGEGYACGWVVKEPSYEIPHKLYWYNGTNTLWYSLLVIIPEKNLIVAVTSNDGDKQNAESAAWEIVHAAVKDFQTATDDELRQSLPSAAYPWRSPFAAVRWDESQPQVQIDGRWYALVSISDVASSDILQFSRDTFGDRWQKRFEEDLVQLLARMGHPPGETVKLQLQPLDGSEIVTLKDVAMTAENRRAIRNAARERADAEP